MSQRPKPMLADKQLATLRSLLFTKRAELRHRIGSIVQATPSGEPGDLGDQAVAEIASDERTELSSTDRTLLSEVEHALAKLDTGTYGASEEDGSPISYERLLALPWARTNVK